MNRLLFRQKTRGRIVTSTEPKASTRHCSLYTLIETAKLNDPPTFLRASAADIRSHVMDFPHVDTLIVQSVQLCTDGARKSCLPCATPGVLNVPPFPAPEDPTTLRLHGRSFSIGEL